MTTTKKPAAAAERPESRVQSRALHPHTQSEIMALVSQFMASDSSIALGTVTAPKTRKTLTLDADLVAEFSGGPDDRLLSPTINAILRREKARIDQHRALSDLLDQLEDADGPVDPERVQYFADLLQ